MTNNRGILVYCIADRLDESIYDIFGLDGENKLFAVGEKNLYALSSYVDLCEYGEESIAQKGEDIEWLKQKAGVFMDIMLRIKATSDIVPMKFITIFTSEDRVKESIRDNLAQFISNFEKIQGCEEISVKFYCDPAVYKDYHMGEELKSFEKSLSGKPKGAGFFLRKKFESEINDKIRDKISKTANGFSEVLRKSAQDMKSNKLLAKEITGIETPMVLNCAFLVKTEQMEGFCKKCGELSAESCIKGFTIEWSGPWPPYHFCR